MADQPARALILYGDGVMRDVTTRHTHVHELAAAGSCGFLALRSQDNVKEEERVVGELAQLLDLYDSYKKRGRVEDDAVPEGIVPSLTSRFMGIKAGMVTNCSVAAGFGKQVGFTVLDLQHGNSDSITNGLQEPSLAASRLLSFLGLQDADKSPGMDFELLLVHLVANQETQKIEDDENGYYIEWINEVLGALKHLSQPGTKASSHLYLVAVLGYGTVEESFENQGASLLSDDVLVPELAKMVPRQSYMLKDGEPIEGIREHHPLLVASYLNAVTRHDKAKAFNFDEFKKHAGNLNIFVERFLHEVAFKLWRAPKYGA